MEIGETIGFADEMNAADKAAGDTCPFCGKAPHDFVGKKKKKPTDKVVSKPKSLKCDTVPGGGAGKHTTAAHHLISAIQCYARVRRLVRMGSLVDYDINSPPNGIGLPTVKNPYKKKKYSELSEFEKDEVSFEVMRKTSAQWHVGHHAFEVKLIDEWVDESGDKKEVGHKVSYDTSVIQLLLDITLNIAEARICEEADDEKNSAGAFIDTMNDISAEIQSHLAKFATANPLASKPFFVSDRAYRFAVAESKI